MTTYRLLTRGDEIRRGDQILRDDCETWSPAEGLAIGMAYSPVVFVPIRRPTTPPAAQSEGGAGHE